MSYCIYYSAIYGDDNTTCLLTCLFIVLAEGEVVTTENVF